MLQPNLFDAHRRIYVAKQQHPITAVIEAEFQILLGHWLMDTHDRNIPLRLTHGRTVGKAASIKASYLYRWDELDYLTFRRIGFIARRTPDGAPRFNFPQTAWMHPRVQMDWSVHSNRAVRTLAVNVLTLLLPERNVNAYFGTTSDRALAGASRFAADFLCTMPVEGGCIPLEILREWIRKEL